MPTRPVMLIRGSRGHSVDIEAPWWQGFVSSSLDRGSTVDYRPQSKKGPATPRDDESGGDRDRIA